MWCCQEVSIFGCLIKKVGILLAFQGWIVFGFSDLFLMLSSHMCRLGFSCFGITLMRSFVGITRALAMIDYMHRNPQKMLYGYNES